MRKRGRPKTETGVGVPVRIHAEIVRQGRVITSANGTDMSAYFSALLKDQVAADYRRLLADESARLDATETD